MTKTIQYDYNRK